MMMMMMTMRMIGMIIEKFRRIQTSSPVLGILLVRTAYKVDLHF